jgi:hypothetical protein
MQKWLKKEKELRGKGIADKQIEETFNRNFTDCYCHYLQKLKYLQQFTDVNNQTTHPLNTPFTYYQY